MIELTFKWTGKVVIKSEELGEVIIPVELKSIKAVRMEGGIEKERYIPVYEEDDEL